MKYNTRINLTIDDFTKKEAEETLGRLGLSISSAVRLFLNKVIETNSIPFEIKYRKSK